ncbi:hypothetical protein B0H10DRAFT_2161180 [Mycena sp. CBHHK59/15]|nr:hypothetical protein B0H10DRAFT_2161180 [Mycena sp. CBHHK59/15]
MYRAPSVFPPENQQRVGAQPYSGQITPGQVTYTTSTGPDGRVIYHSFSYQTPTGIVSGIQWVPAESTQIVPAGAQPANSEFAAAWHRGVISKEDQKALKEWQRDEEKRRKKEEKEAKRLREKEQRSTSGQYGDADSELRKARERDAQAMASRERRKSFNQGTGAVPSSLAFPTSGATSGGYPVMGTTGYSASSPNYPATNPNYPATAYTAGYNGVPAVAPGYEQRDRKYSTGAGALSDLDRQFGDLEVDRNREYGSERERKVSGLTRPSKYQTDPERARRMSNNFGDRPVYNTSGSYGTPNTYSAQTAGNQYASGVSPYPNPSPNMRPGESPFIPPASSNYVNSNYPTATTPFARPTTPYGGSGPGQVYPPGHIMEGKQIPRSRATTPILGAAGLGMQYPSGPVGFPSMQMPDSNAADQGQLAAPEGFSRPINAAQAYTPFESMKIQDMDDLIQNMPRMPADLCLAWTGRLPAPGRPQKKATLAADVIDLWNVSFFFPRGVEVVLYKGRERRSGPNAGLADIRLPTYDESDELSSSSSSSSEDSDSDSGGRHPPATYMYGQQPFAPGQGSMAEVLEQRRTRREARADKKRRRKEKKSRRKAKAREKKFALYLTCVPNGGPGAANSMSGMNMGMGMGTSGMMGMGASGMGGMGAPGMGGMGNTPGMGGMPTSMGAPGYGAVAGGMPMSNQLGGGY